MPDWRTVYPRLNPARALLRVYDAGISLAGMPWIALKRLRGQPWLAVISTIGVAMAVALAVSVPVFAQAVSRAIMEDELDALAAQVGRPRLALRVYLLPSSKRPVTAQQALDLAPGIARIYESNLDIPVHSYEVVVESVGLMLKPAEESSYGEPLTLLGSTKAAFVTGIEERIRIVSGEPMGGQSPADAVRVWMHESWAMELGVLPGEAFVVQPILHPVPIKVEVAGTWLPKNAQDPYWPTDPNGSLRMVLLMQPEEYTTRIQPYLGNTPVGSVSWAINLDERGFVPELADQYVRGFGRSDVDLSQLLPEARCDVSPVATLQGFLDRRRPLTLLLFSFSVPIIGFLLYFLTLVSGIVVDSQRQVTATMVSRGLGSAQLSLISFFEGLILVVLGAPLGVLAGLGLARLMGHTASFMQFVARSPLNVSLSGVNLWLVVLTMGVALCARLWPVIREGRRSIVEHTRQAARPGWGSFWVTCYVNVLLIVPTVYAYRQLRQQGTIVLLGWEASGDIFRDPVLFLVPVLFMLAASLLSAQLFPVLMRLLDRLISRRLGLVWCLTLRQLGRQGGQYVSSLLLIMASLSVGVFMASMASSLDRWLEDRVHYRLGSDVTFRIERVPESEGGPPATPDENIGAWAIPWEELLALPGIEAATSVGSYRARLPLRPDAMVRGRFVAVDRATFPAGVVYRSDFSADSLGELMNRLAVRPDGVLVSRRFLEASNRVIGDPLNIKVSPDGAGEIDLRTVIVGVFDYFPTIYEDEAPAVVGSLDYLMMTAGGVSTFDIWLKSDWARVNPAELPRAVLSVVRYYTHYRDVWTLITEERERKERIGVYGTLSIGFLASLALSGIGLLIQYHRSLQERLFRFATLRAIGITRRQLVAQVQLEYLVVLAVGVLAGVWIGVEASRVFIPYFRVSTPDGRLPLPPLLLLLDRQSIVVMAAAFALLQVAMQSGLIRRAMRSELFQVLRMGSQE